jgi:hypothetical protein
VSLKALALSKQQEHRRGTVLPKCLNQFGLSLPGIECPKMKRSNRAALQAATALENPKPEVTLYPRRLRSSSRVRSKALL